jgi:hypothetical protein
VNPCPRKALLSRSVHSCHRPQSVSAPLLATSTERQVGQHLITRIDQVVDLNMGFVELAPPPVPELAECSGP